MKPDVSIVIPAYNEEDRLRNPLRQILEFARISELALEVIVVDDGSNDGTDNVAEGTFADYPAIISQVIRYEKNRGKGFAAAKAVATSWL